jgi:radical SAM family uncharacterized protein/radical SAM-linked protein
LKQFLSLVSKPVRYLGQEIHSIRKDPAQVKLKFCLAFPDVYEVGMSHLGIQILYHLLNEKEGVACERVFAPWVDMEKVLRERSVPLSSLESSLPLSQFDIIGFSLQYELSFTNVLNMLDLSHIPLLSKERDDQFPLIIAGGPSCFNPAPVADFFDAMVLGDGEEVVLEICDRAILWKERKGKKEELLRSLSQVEGVYVPTLHREGQKVHKRIVADLNPVLFPACPILPYMKVIHDRLNVEIARGCKRGCRFCEAGFIHRPYRERSPEGIEEILHASLHQTGYEEVSLLSLSAGDYTSIRPLLSDLMDRFESKKVAVSFPSLRIETVVGSLAEEVKRVRKTGFTIAPEAGTERLRKVINKELDERVLFQGLEDLFSKGWKHIKLYFMIGLPTEREEDLKGIIDLSRRISSLGGKYKIHPNVAVSVSTFVPKPHTPFQWEPQIPLEEMKEKLHFLREGLRGNRIQFKWQDPHLSYLEGIFSTGSSSLSRVLLEAFRLGCRFDGWSDQFRYDLWTKAFEMTGVKMDLHTKRKSRNDLLPWSFIETGASPDFLWEEYEKALRGESSPPCGRDCQRCGICDEKIQVKEFPTKETRSRVQRDFSAPKKEMKRKVRMRFAKEGDVRFLSHLELAHLFHRASRRADLPLSYSEGFHPMPRIVFARALPVGVESQGEIVDMELEGKMTGVEVMERLNQTLPPGLKIMEVKEVSLHMPSPSFHDRSVYWISLDHLLSKEETLAKIRGFLEKEEFFLTQERKGKRRSVDVRPLIEEIDVREQNSHWGVELVVRGGMGRSAKASEIIGAITGLGGDALSQCRIVKME